jgi:hypothetical protein
MKMIKIGYICLTFWEQILWNERLLGVEPDNRLLLGHTIRRNNAMQFKRSILVTAFIIFVMTLFAAPALAQTPGMTFPADTITVTGLGEASSAPDMATLIFGVETFDTDISTAFARTNETIEAVIKAIVAAGVDRADIRTVGLNIYQDRSGMVPAGMALPPLENGQNPTFYSVGNQVRVTVRDIENVANVINVGVEAGANGLYGLEFSISNRIELETEARAAAFADAQARAAELAALMGAEVGDVVSIYEPSNFYSPYDMAQRAFGGGGNGAVIEPGQLAVGISLQVTFSVNR